MDADGARQARLELRIVRPAASPDWTVRRIEWLEPAGVRIAGRRDEAHAQPTLAASLAPRDAVGRWFGADPTLWARYPSDRTPVHRVRLRLSFERPGGAPHEVVISPVFPAMSWAPEAARRKPRRPLAARKPGRTETLTARSRRPRDWGDTDAPSLA
jgi:hypothetical protein